VSHPARDAANGVGAALRGLGGLLAVRPWAWGVLAIAHAGAALELQPLATWFYPLAWWSYVAIADGVLMRRGAPALLGPPWRVVRLLGLAFASWAFWLLYEAVNLRIADWFYVGVPEVRPLRWLGISLSFATVLPLLLVTERLVDLGLRPDAFRVRPMRLSAGGLVAVQVAGVLFLLLPLAFPDHAFPLVWGFLPLLLDPVNRRAGRPSLLADWERGSARRFVALLLAGLICGLMWEAWNYLAVGRWIYTVPYLDRVKLFEMPPLGFLGFPPLAVAGYVFLAWLDGEWRRAGAALRALAAALTLVAGLSVLWGMDRETVAAVVPRLEGVAPLDGEARAALRRHGEGSVRALARLPGDSLPALARAAGIDPETLAAARAWARLAGLKGLGNENVARLWALGIRDAADLARQDPAALAARLGGPLTERRLRVWVRAAGRSSRAR
jgi:Domain of unknown function (DUF4332)